jgi:hypothetical protein
MKRTIFPVAIVALIAASPAVAQTQKQSEPDSPGASSNAPGQKMQSDREKGKDSPGPGASGYAPRQSTTGSGSDSTPKSK